MRGVDDVRRVACCKQYMCSETCDVERFRCIMVGGYRLHIAIYAGGRRMWRQVQICEEYVVQHDDQQEPG